MSDLRIKAVGAVPVSPPEYKTDGSAGLDLCAALETAITLPAGEQRLVPTGYAIALPPGHEAQVQPRSGLALKHGITVLNSPGPIDEDYRGAIGIVLINHGRAPFVIEPNMRIAQLIVAPVTRVNVQIVDDLSATERGAGGYGSTGV